MSCPWRRRRVLVLGVLAVALVAVAVVAGLGEAASGPVAISVKLDSAGKGTFRMTGTATDAGRVVVARRTAGGRLVVRQTLTGAKGTLVLSSTQRCTRSTGTWQVLSGTDAYARASGGGTTTGRVVCTRPWRASTVVHRGSLAVPPPPLAAAGSYRGWTTQGKEVSFDVAPDGRTLVNLLFGGYTADCVNQNGLRMAESSGVDQKVLGPVPIADDRTFALELGSALRRAKVSGRFVAPTATGTIATTYEWEAGGHIWKCAGDVAWTVTTPAPPQWQAVAGKYCGITPQGEGVCLDVPAGGRELRNVDVGFQLICGETGFLLRLTVEGPVQLRSDLSFQTSFTQALGDDSSGSTRAFLTGTFDRSGSMTGRITLQQPVFTYQGTRYTCRNGGASWTAKLQS